MSPRAFDEYDQTSGEGQGSSQRRAPGTVQYRAPESESIIRRVIDIIDSSPGLPMSSSVRVNKEEVLELLEEAASRLPDELRSARWLIKEREEYRANTRREGEAILADASSRAARMVERQEVVKAAQASAAQIMSDAEAASRRMRREAEDFCDQKLASFENVLARVQKTVAVGRQRLAAPTIEESELAGGGETDAASEQPAGSPVFDQDL